MRMRFRTDGMSEAEAHALFLRGVNQSECPCEQADCSGKRVNWEKVPPMEPGDVWRARWHGTEAIAGYWMCCVKCGELHPWTTATNCSTRTPMTGVDGKTIGYRCAHTSVGSCWDWSGSAEDNTLTAHPSLLCYGCGWHGWLQNGDIHE